jgi:hypothetical protein
VTRASGDPQPRAGEAPSTGGVKPDPAPERRPWLERIGLASIALVMGGLLAVMGIVAWAGGEWILAAMSASGAVLTLGVAVATLVRG